MRSLALFLTLFLVVSGCDDPSSAGLEFVDEDGTRPTSSSQEATAAAEVPDVRDETGGDSRILVGTVIDPITGSVSTNGYLDFSEPLTPPSAFRTGPVTEVTVVLRPNYTYGDTLTTGSLVLSDMIDAWTSLSVAADTQLVAGAQVTTVPFSPTDSVVSVSLPTEWIAANEPMLRSTGSDTLFHGFQVTAIGTNAVVGFETASAVLRVVSGGESLDFPVSRRLTTAQRLAPPTPPAERLSVQDTAGPGVRFEFDLSDDTLATSVINRGEIRMHVDTTAFANNLPPNFIRPAVTSLELRARTSNGSTIVLGNSNIRDGVASFSGSLVRAALQGIASDAGVIDYFVLVVAPDQGGLGAVVLNAPGTGLGPSVVITASRI